jgi:hypothetical protein
MTKIRSLLCDPRWITAFLALAVLLGGASTWAFGEWQLRADIRSHLTISDDIPDWRVRVDQQIKLLTYLACRNETMHHTDAAILECEEFRPPSRP